jgi:ankyrin repeat protein
MASRQKVREVTQPERSIQKAVMCLGMTENVEWLKIPDGLENDAPRLAAALGAVTGATCRINEIVLHFTATHPSLNLLPQFFDREIRLLCNNRFYFSLQASLAPRALGQLSDAPVNLKPFFEALLLDDVEIVKPWLIREDVKATRLRVRAEILPACLPVAIESNTWAALSPLQANCQLVDDYSLLELSAGAGAARCVRFFAEFLHCPVTGVALQLAVRCGNVELMRDLLSRLERLRHVPEFVLLPCARAAIEHCRGAALAWFLQDADSCTLEHAATIAIVWRKAGPTRRLSRMGVDFQNLAATAGWPSLYGAVGSIVGASPLTYSSLMHAVMRGSVAVALDLLGKGAEVNERGRNGQSALHLAALSPHLELPGSSVSELDFGDSEILPILIEAGADAELRNDFCQTPLHISALVGHVAAVRALVQAHADLEVAGKKGWRALHLASDSDHVEILRILIGAHANVEAQGSGGESPLSLAAAAGHFEAVRILLAAHTNVESRNKSGYTALHFAASRGHAEVVRILLEAGANKFAQNNAGGTAFALAQMCGHIKAATLLTPERTCAASGY